MDLDTTSTKWSHQRILAPVEAGEVDLLLGTQMIAKGLDFPNVTLVGVVDADTGLYLPDFRSAERTFQLAGPGGGPRGAGAQGRAACWCRPGTRRTTRSSGPRGTTPKGSCTRSGRCGESPPYPPEHVAGEPDRVGSRGAEVGPASGAEVADWCAALRREARAAVDGAGPGAVSAGPDQGAVALARAAEGARRTVLGRVVRYAARRGLTAGDGDAGGDRSGSGVAAVGCLTIFQRGAAR